jgi:hypothetical protein
LATVNGFVAHNVSFSMVATGLVGTPSIGSPLTPSNRYTSGTGPNQCDLFYEKVLLLAATPTTLDLTALTAPDGSPVNLARVRLLIVQTISTTAAQKVTVSGGATNPWVAQWGAAGSMIAWPGNGVVVAEDPLSTGAGTGLIVTSTSKSVKLDPGTATLSVYVVIAGCSTA